MKGEDHIDEQQRKQSAGHYDEKRRNDFAEPNGARSSANHEPKNIGALPVVENGQVKGMITDRDITLRVSSQGKDPSTVKVAEVMTNQVVTGTPNMSVQEAANVMAQHQVRRLPIVENNQLQGIVALGDIATNSASNEAAEQALTNISEPSQPQG